MWCSCQDEAYAIPKPQRIHGIKEGALWCVGSLSMAHLDGTVGIIYNPYTMEELSIGMTGVTTYINCLSENSDSSKCSPPNGQNTQLMALVEQSVEPLAVWARCKTNYAHKMWDVGAGAIFSATSSSSSSSVGPAELLQNSAIDWGNAL